MNIATTKQFPIFNGPSPDEHAKPPLATLAPSNTPLRNLSDAELTRSFATVAAREREATNELIEHIREFEARRLYLQHGVTSIYAYMTQHLHYAGTTALNRIHAARMISEVPNLQADLLSGEINLTQVTLLTQSLRQKENEAPESAPTTEAKRALFEKIKGLDVKQSVLIVARELDLKLKTHEKIRLQKDGSSVIELTFTKEQMAALSRLKDILSHTHHGATWADLIGEAVCQLVERKDPARPRGQNPARRKQPDPAPRDIGKTQGRSMLKQQTALNGGKPKRRILRVAIPAETRRQVFQRDQGCQWPHKTTRSADKFLGDVSHARGGMIKKADRPTAKCGSTFLLQVDHIRSVREGGGNELENLQLLCAIHNRLKYDQEDVAKF